MGIYIQILLIWFNGDFSHLDTTGYRYWRIEGEGVYIGDSLPIFASTGRISYLEQTAEDVDSPYVYIALLDRCPDMYIRVRMVGFSNGKRVFRDGRSRDSLRIQGIYVVLEGRFDSLRIRISAHSRFKTGCRIPITSMKSNFLKNTDFREYSVFPSGWGGRNVEFDGGISFERKGILGRYLDLEPGTVFRMDIDGEGDFRVRLNYIMKRKKVDIEGVGYILDTVPAFNGMALLTLESSGGFLKGIGFSILDTLPLVVNPVRGGVHIFSNMDDEKIYIYDSDGNIARTLKLKRGAYRHLKLDRGEYLILVPRIFRKRIYVR